MGQSMRVVFCSCTYGNVVPREVKHEVLKALCASGVAFDAVPDLCEMSARKGPAMMRIAESANVRIAACYPRAVRWLFHAADASLRDQGVALLDMRQQSAEQVVAGLLSAEVPTSERQL